MKRIISFILALILAFSFSISVFSHDEKQHNKDLTKVLFGKTKVEDPDGDLKLLKAASYLALDQFNGDGEDKLDVLKKGKVKDIPESISAIDFDYNSYHRRFTHKGWNYDYSIDSKGDEAHWEIRKSILCSTANKIFDFGADERGNKFGEKCDSFSALVYYIHVLGDHSDSNNAKKDVGYTIMLPFARKHADENTPDLFYELKTYSLEILFKDQEKTSTYKKFIKKYDKLAKKARNLQGETGGIQTEEQKEQWAEYKDDLFDLLKKYIPDLLEEEDFFAEVFYTD